MLPTVATFFVTLMIEGRSSTTPWWDYPGLEVWKFFNLFIFVAVMVYLLKRPLSDAFRNRREAIRAELLKARTERDAALARLAEVQVRLDRLDSEVAGIKEHSVSEAQAERERILRDTEQEILKLQEQSQREILSAGKVARHELRLFAAQQSVKVAEEVIRREIRPEDDSRLMELNVEQLGRR
ncbi:MAG: synthase subunit [Acidobacteria bacterium]|nr:synthase subunit [Acidobacteriota bacterium]